MGLGWRLPCLEKGVAEDRFSPDKAERLRALPVRGWLEGSLYAQAVGLWGAAGNVGRQ